MGTIATAEVQKAGRLAREEWASPGREKVSSTLISLALGLPLALYNVVLVEAKRRVLLGKGPFLREESLGDWDKAFFLVLFSTEVLVLVVTLAALLATLLKPLLRSRSASAKGSVVLIGMGYFWAVTAQYGVLRYFKDELDLALIRDFGGGDPRAALAFVQNEFAGLLPLVLISLVVMLVGGWLLRRFSYLVRSWLSQLWLTRLLSSRRGLLITNGVFILSPVAVFVISPQLHYALSSSIAHRLYSAPAAYLTDFDADGYGFMSRPVDFAPFDSSRHPYAVEIPGNGVDENGVGGDLPVATWNRTVIPWDATKLHRKNVLLIVMDSARYDLLEAEVSGVPVMPVLRSLPGQRIAIFSHAGYTVPSSAALLNGTVSEQEKGISLVDRFNALGYRTGVFSSQDEGYGDMAKRAHMDRAEVFFDGRSFPKERRMYASTVASALTVPAPLVNAKFAEWFNSIDHSQPFFAYLNWQEMHFPYHYNGAPTPLLEQPIPRSRIVPANRPWLYRTYLNAARSLDEALDHVVALLDQAGVRQETLMVVVGDHGEELFENGYLGHGINLGYEQNATLCKLINSRWEAPRKPLGLSDVGTLVHNAMARSPQDALPLGDEVLCYVGDAEKPNQIGVVTPEGIVKYDFTKDLWTKQARPGAGFSRSGPAIPVIHLWESYVVKQLAPSRPARRTVR